MAKLNIHRLIKVPIRLVVQFQIFPNNEYWDLLKKYVFKYVFRAMLGC